MKSTNHDRLGHGTTKFQPPDLSFTLTPLLLAFALRWAVHPFVQGSMPLRP